MLIVLEGLDGAGKSTQIKLLREWLTAQGMESEYLHFPRFDAPVYGDLIARFLRGEFGGVESVNPYLVALIYAGDRADAAPQLREWLAAGKTVVLDRYVYSNVGYQCAKVADAAAREALARWIVDLEYDYHRIPRPDVSLFLDVPFAFTEHKLAGQRAGDDRSYLNGARDIHEDSLLLQQRVREVYLAAARTDAQLRVIDCGTPEETMASPETIFERIRAAVEPLLNRRP